MICEPTPNTRTVIGGRYTIYDEIGAGGMAAVYMGKLRGAGGFARTVAIKRLHAALAHDEEFVSMFMQEAQLAARIRHPNVVQTLDVVAENGELFLVMEYVLGEPLSHVLRRLVKSPVRVPHCIVAAIMSDVLHGLHAAHETKSASGRLLGLVHRDVSPQNVLLGVDGIARVLDFGIAKSAASGHTSRAGTVRGKFPYLAPEQIAGETVDKTADIYSASVVFWELLTNRRLFVGDTPQATMARVLAGCDCPPSANANDVSDIYDDIVMRGLSRDPANRFATARDMADAVAARVPHVGMTAVARWIAENAGDSLKESSERLARVDRDGVANSESAMRCRPAELNRVARILVEEPTRVETTAHISSMATQGTATVEVPLRIDTARKPSHRGAMIAVVSIALAFLASWGVLKSSTVAAVRPVAMPLSSQVMLVHLVPPVTIESRAEPSPLASASPTAEATKRQNNVAPRRSHSRSSSPFSTLGGRL